MKTLSDFLNNPDISLHNNPEYLRLVIKEHQDSIKSMSLATTSLVNTIKTQHDCLQKANDKIKELLNNVDSAIILSSDEVISFAFNSKTPDKLSKQCLKVLIRADKIKKKTGLDIQFVLSSNGSIKVKCLPNLN